MKKRVLKFSSKLLQMQTTNIQLVQMSLFRVLIGYWFRYIHFCKHYFSRIMFMFYIFVFFVGIKWWEWCCMSSWTMHQISTCPYEKVWQGQKELLVGLTHKTLMSVSPNKGNLGTKRGNSVWFAPTYDLQVRSAVALLINAVNPA